MAKAYAKWFYNSKAWLRCRASFIADRINVDGGICQECQAELGYIVDHVDEITPENIHDAETTLNHENLRYLCLVCHTRKTFGVESDDRYYFDSEGQIVPLPPKK